MDVHPTRLHTTEDAQHRLATVTQGSTNGNATTVICNALEGRVIMHAVLANATGASFQVTDSLVDANSHILVGVVGITSTSTLTRLALTARVESQTTGSFVVNVYNADIASTVAAPVVTFRVAA